MTKEGLFEIMKGSIIVSCQATPGEPLYDPERSVMPMMARAAQMAGARMIRTSSVRDIVGIKEATGLPVIGLIKREYPGYQGRITMTMREVDECMEAMADSVSIDEKSGALNVMTSTGELVTIGYLAIAKVTNPNGVTHVDGRYYQAQSGAGEVRVTSIQGAVEGVESAGDTKLITGGLESSGTDLATEITNMITVQRGYQANTRIITVTDSMLEELVNMKR